MVREEFKNKVLGCSWITEAEFKQLWVDCGASPDSDMVTFDVSDKFKNQNPHLHRDCGANILSLIQNSENGLKLNNSIEFAADSLFCEWCYVVDFDKNKFEVYQGFNKKPLDEADRFYFLTEKCNRSFDGTIYYPVKLVKSFSLDELPTDQDFIDFFNDDE